MVRLESDSRPVCRRLVSLIFNSFLPVNLPEEVWCERCVTLLQMNHAAARRFYQYAHEHTACTNIGTHAAPRRAAQPVSQEPRPEALCSIIAEWFPSVALGDVRDSILLLKGGFVEETCE